VAGPPHRRVRPPAPSGPSRTDSNRRLRIGLIVLLAVSVLLAGRLVQLQGVEGPRYAALAQTQMLHLIPLPAQRGQILDRNGLILAESVDARDIYADPEQIQQARALAAKIPGQTAVSAQQIADQLAPLVKLPVGTLLARFAEHEQFVYLARGVTPAVGDAVDKLNLPGIGVLDSTRRVYPDGSLAASVMGFVGTDGSGLAGMEYADNSLLSGTAGSWLVQTGADGRVIPDGRNVQKPARAGQSIELTIDRDIQWEAERALSAQVAATHSLSGTVIVMDPRSGEILALADEPSFDPNNPGAAPAANLGDAAATDVYEPGSVNKVITMSAALQDGLDNPLTPLTVPPSITVAGSVFHDAEVHGTEHLTLTGVLALSSNIGAIEVAQQLGPARLYQYLRAYGFGEPTGAGLPGEAAGILPPVSHWSGTTLPTVAFGQGIAVTALQVALVYATVANGGVRVTPSILRGVLTGNRFVPAPPPSRRRVISTTVAHELTDMLEAVTTDLGTAPAAQIPGYRVAGKTGTANRSDGKGAYSGYTASFVGFAPADRPQLLVEVVLQRPEGDIYGGAVAAPVFRDVMSFALESLHIPPTGTKPPVAQIFAP
jgi:cell division protein FtsI (penicillin-binding protein 3)